MLDDTVANSPSVAIGDVNGDGRLDIVTADSYYGTLRVFSGDGNGGLSDPTVIHTGASMLSLTLGDVNGDGKVDIVAAVAGSANGPGVVVLPQNSQGSFSAADLISLSSSSFDYAGSHYPTSVAVTPAQGIVNYTENHAPIAIDPYLTLSDADSPMLSSAKVQITNFVSGEDVLGFTNQNGITSSYNAATGVMTLSGTASLANYQAVLRSVTYANSSYDPSATPRTVSFSVNDGATLNSDSNIQSATVIVIPVNDAPVATVPTSHYSATAQANLNLHNTGLSVADVDGGSSVETATLSASQGIITVSAGDSNVSNISGNGSGSVSFSGTIAQINALLNSGSASEIYNYNAGYSATTVTLDLAIRDAGNLSSSTSSTIDVAGSGPKAFADTIAATAGRPTSGLSAVLKSNDIGTPLTIVSVDNAQHGSVALNGSDPIFTPDANYSGVASFAYTISDAASPPAPGMFGTQTVATVGTSPYALATGDFNGDGKLDVLVANSGSNTVSFLAGNGDGTYAPKQDITVGGTPVAISTGDINHYGKLDFVVANNSGSFSVLLGNGNGTFQTSSITGGLSSALPNSIVLGDVNNDGSLDLVSIISQSGVTKLWTQLGNGDGTFQSRTTQVATGGAEAQAVILADVNGDGKLDAIVADGQVDNAVNILLGNGNGTYQTRTGIATQSQPVALSTGDINHDGKLDLVVADAGANRISVFLGNGNGTFQAESTWLTQSKPVDVKLVDFNEDGNLDLVFVDSGADRVSTRLGNGNGTFQSELTYATGASPYAVAVGDLNSDGRPDLIAANYGGGTLSTLLNAAPGGHLSSATVTVNIAPAIKVAVIGSSDSSDTALAAQLNDSTYFNFAATVINTNSYSTSSAWTSAPANYDVVVVGDSGHNDPLTFGTTTFTALYAALHAYVDGGHGVLSTGWYDFPITSGYSVLGSQALADADYISPDQAGGSYGSGPIAGTATFTGSNPITYGISSFSADPYWERPAAMDASATILATVGSTPVVAYENHLVYLAPIYMGTPAAYDTSSLRSGVPDHLLENSVAWASGSLDAVIHTDGLQVSQNSGSTIISGLVITDNDPAATSFTISAVTSGVGSSTLTPTSGSGSLAAINAELASGISYNPGSTPPATDKVALTVADNVGATDTVNFILNQAGTGPSVTLTGTNQKDVFFATGYQDTFEFAANSNKDVITNGFQQGSDKIDLHAIASIDSTALANILNTADHAGGDMLLHLNGNIDTILVKGVASLASSDFILHA
ncbi:MAG: FG-GAP-like repeat-containing protein [Afipia sp.]|nr:FG-GAP-like repeat-containing protein [Afipia sp.]